MRGFHMSRGEFIRWLAAPFLCLHVALGQAAWQKTDNTTAVTSGSYGRYWTLRDTVSGAATRANAVLVDGAGNVYSTGALDAGTSAVADLIVSRHDSAGNLLWEDVYGAAGLSDEGVALALDGAGNLYVAGLAYNVSDADIIVAKYLPDGTQAWLVRYDSGADDEPVAIATDGANVYVTGRSRGGAGLDIVTLRYDSGGLNPRVQVYDNNGGDDQPVGIALGAAGEVLVGGVSAGANKDYVLLKYPAGLTASPLWVVRYDSGNGDDNATAMAAAGGRVFITGSSFSRGTRNFLTVAFNEADGSRAWVAATGYLSGSHIPAAIASEGARVFVTGRSIHRDATNTTYDLLTLSYDAASGAASFPIPATYDSGGDDEALAIVVDGAGNSYVLGQSGMPGARNLVTVLYDSVGVQRGAFVHDGGGDETAGLLMSGGARRLSAQTLALGSDNKGLATVHVAGSGDRPQPATGTVEVDYTLLKYGVMRSELQVASISGPTQAASGSSMDVSATIANVQDSTAGSLSDAGPFSIGLYLADGPDPLTANLTLLGTRDFTGLASGQNSPTVTTVPIPDAVTLPEGTYYLTVKADWLDQVMERDEDNNLRIGPAVNIVNPPDLVPASIAVTSPGGGSAPAGTGMTLQYAIDNVRAVPTSGPFQVNFVLTANNVVGDGDDIFLGSDTVTSIIGGNSSLPPTSVVVTIPPSAPAGAYFVGIIVDANDDILEASDANNTLATTGTFNVQPIPDLSVSSVSSATPGAVADGTTPLDLNYTVRSSAAPASGVGVNFYLSTDSVITTSDLLLGTATVNLAADSPLAGTLTVTIPSGTAQGVYYVGAIIDAANGVVESDETNNSRAAAETTSVGLPSSDPAALPDLMVSSVTAPGTAARGSTITVNTTVTNILPRAAGAFRLGIYLSSDSTITTADLLLGSRSVGGLAGYGSDSAPTDVVIPFTGPSPITWTNAVGVSVNGNSLTKTAATGWNAGASSVQVVPGDGIVEFTATETTTIREIGLSYSDTTQSFTEHIRSLRLKATGYIDVYSGGSLLFTDATTYAPGDKFRIQRIPGVTGKVSFQKNGVEFATTPSLGNANMVVDTALYTTGATLDNVNLIVPLNPGVYYLGAIADDQSVVSEVNEGNNAALQSNGSTVVSVMLGPAGASASGGAGGGGGGAWGLASLFLCLLAALCRPAVPGRMPR